MGVVSACAFSFISKYLHQSCSPKPMTRVDINDNNQSSNKSFLNWARKMCLKCIVDTSTTPVSFPHGCDNENNEIPIQCATPNSKGTEYFYYQ